MPYQSLLHRTAHLLEVSADAVGARLRHRFGYDDPLRIQPFRGYGNERIVRLGGRVLADPAARHPRERDEFGPLDNLGEMLRRYVTDEVDHARIQIELGGVTEEVVSDAEGYLDVSMDAPRLDQDRLWHEVRFRLLEPAQDDDAPVEFVGEVQIPRRARLGIISDLDDTVVRTGANRFLKHWRTVLLNNAQTRTPFDGVATFYRALQAGEDDALCNPIFYLSSSPWNLYDLFERFMALHEIPPGTLMLADYGIDERKFLHGGHRDHKSESIRRVLEDFPELGFVLVGDTGQCDVEIYADLAREFSERIEAIYIRDVTTEARDREVDAVAESLEEAGVPMLRVADSLAAARDACERGFIEGRDVDQVREAVERG